jgi:hypothetical protein
MALTRRAVATTLAALTVAGAVAQPAQAYWRANGTGTGTVSTAAAAANVLTVQLTATGSGHTVKAAGKAGNGSPYQATITVYLCKSSPCNAGNAAATLTTTQSGGNYTVTSGNLNTWATVYGQANQLQNSNWRDYATAPAAVSNP